MFQSQKRGRQDALDAESQASTSSTKREKTVKHDKDDPPGSATLSSSVPAKNNWPAVRYDDGLMAKNQKEFLLDMVGRMKLTKAGSLFLRDAQPLSVLLNDPEYQKVIKRHVDLDIIEKGISKGDYLAVHRVVDEFELMIKNAFLFWGAGHENSDQAMQLRQWFFEKMQNCPKPLIKSEEPESNNALEDAEPEPVSCRWDNRRTFVVCGLPRQTLEKYEAEDRAKGLIKPQTPDRRTRRSRHKKKTSLKGTSASEDLDENGSREQPDNTQDEPGKYDQDEAARLRNIIENAKTLLAVEERKGKKVSDRESDDVVVEVIDLDDEGQELKKKIEDLQSQLANNMEKKKLLAEIENLDSEDVNLNGKVIEMEKQCTLLRSQVENHGKEMDKLDPERKKLDHLLLRHTTEEARIHREQQRLNQEIDRIRKEKERHRQESDKTNSDIALHNERGAKLTQEHEKLKKDYSRVYENREELKLRREELEMQRKTAKEKFRRLNKIDT